MPKNPKETSPKVASVAGELLPKKGIPKKEKEPIASALAQAPLKAKPKRKSKKKS